jgi:molecular chaperone DnaK (HSP70)
MGWEVAMGNPPFSLVPHLAAAARSLRAPVTVWGIDLGTTNSALVKATWRAPGEPPSLTVLDIPQRTLEGTYYSPLLPSVVALWNGQVFVGEGAKRLSLRAGEFHLKPYETFFFETKNHMGLRRSYPRAPEGFRSPKEIAAHILRALQEAGEADGPEPSRVVVTVPASFQLNQRRDTLEAAALAGLALQGGELLDEPVAALLDYLFSEPSAAASFAGGSKNLVVFDFGGGTCDVAVMAVGVEDGRLVLSQRAVSRYHRLGGGDIDAAIVYEVLLPELFAQNQVSPDQVDFFTKKQVLEPALRGIAESLKIALSQELERLAGFGGKIPETTAAKLSLTHVVQVPNLGVSWKLAEPTLTLQQFQALLAPFLDQELLFLRETEYRSTCSIFAPLEDALDRAKLEPSQVDFCLLVGGSSQLPQVQQALRSYFSRAQLLAFQGQEGLQLAVARGAAWHALALALVGKPVVEVRSQATLALRTEKTVFPLVSQGTPLPFPAQGFKRYGGLQVPVTALSGEVPLRVEVVRQDGGELSPVFQGLWRIPAPVTAGTPLVLDVRQDENQILDMELRLEGAEETQFRCQIENPLTHVVNPGRTRLELEELEERIRQGQVTEDDLEEALERVANLCSELGQRERAFAILKRLLARKARPDAYLLNRLGILAGEMGQHDTEEKLYREAIAADPSFHVARFNLALALWRRGKLQEAEQALAPALAQERIVPNLVLGARIAFDQQQEQRGSELLAEALAQAPRLGRMSDWELGWLADGAKLAGDAALERKCREERQRRAQAGERGGKVEGVLPALKDDWLA